MAVIKNVLAKMTRFLKRSPKPPAIKRRSKEQLGGGHRGVAIGSLKKPDYSAENVQKWRNLPASDVEDFVYNGQPLFVHSTNVASASYEIGSHVLVVEYKDGSKYAYSDVTEDEAIGFAKAQSKGAYVWDVLRVRGTKTQHKKKFSKIG